jgi:hypothetical protein
MTFYSMLVSIGRISQERCDWQHSFVFQQLRNFLLRANTLKSGCSLRAYRVARPSPEIAQHCDVSHRYQSTNEYGGIERSSAVSLASRADTAIRRAWRSFAHLALFRASALRKRPRPQQRAGQVGQTWRSNQPPGQGYVATSDNSEM